MAGLHRPRKTKEEQVRDGELPKGRTFEVFAEAYERLDNIFTGNPSEENFPSRIMGIGELLQQSYEQDANKLLGALLLCEDGKYPVRHSIYTALICEVILQALGWDREERLSTLAAALTMNIAMMDLQEMLHSQKEPLGEQQKQEIHNHPRRGFDMLREFGVTDRVWLDAVLNHHERLDGSGYTRGLKGEAVSMPARVVAIGDLYCAQISSRTYLESMLPN